MKIMAIDLGDAHTGLACCDRTETLASPIGVIHDKDMNSLLAKAAAAVLEYNAGEVVRELIHGFDIMDPVVFFGMLVGAAIPAVFSAMLMLGVDKNAQRMVAEIHRQFKEIIGLKEGKKGVTPEYGKCIEIATSGALKELIPAGLMAIVSTLLVGFIGGVSAVGGCWSKGNRNERIRNSWKHETRVDGIGEQ